MKSEALVSRRRACAISRWGDHLLLVQIQDPVTRQSYWVPPGGGMEEDEDPVHTAYRECLEETGIKTHVIPESLVVKTYPFEWKSILYETTTHFFLAPPLNFEIQNPQEREAYILSAEWKPLKAALELLKFHEQIFLGVSEVLFRHGGSRPK